MWYVIIEMEGIICAIVFNMIEWKCIGYIQNLQASRYFVFYRNRVVLEPLLQEGLRFLLYQLKFKRVMNIRQNGKVHQICKNMAEENQLITRDFPGTIERTRLLTNGLNTYFRTSVVFLERQLCHLQLDALQELRLLGWFLLFCHP